MIKSEGATLPGSGGNGRGERRIDMVNFLLWLVVGALAGWLVGNATLGGTARRIRTSMVVGVVGAILGGLSFSNLLGVIGSVSGEGAVHLSSLLVAFVGAMILSEVVSLVQQPGPVAQAGSTEAD
jgi:uncharacterized membrane protein YeaQ/YmgE (transglycosylase-associated protein family)